MADIASVATLDSTPFTKGLNDALAASKRWRKQVLSTLDFQPLTRFNQELALVKKELGSAGRVRLTVDTSAATAALNKATAAARAQKRELSDVEKAILEYRNKTLGLRNAVESGLISQQEGIRLAIQFRDESLAAAKGADMWSKEWRELIVASGRADRTLATLEGRVTKLGLSQNVAIANTHSLTSAYQQLAGALTAVFATAGVARYIRSLVDFSAEASVAQNTISLFFEQMRQSGVPVAAAERGLSALARQFQTTEDAVASGVTQLVRYGATFDQAIHILQRGGASALAAGKTAAQGFENVTQAIIGEMSASLNRIGIAGNLSTAFQKYAKDLGTTTEALTNQQKIQAITNITLRETDLEYAALDTTLSGFVGAQNRATTAWTNFRRAAGKGAETFLAPLFNLATGLLNLFNSLPAPIQTAVTGLALVSGAVAGIAVAYATVKSVLVKAQVAQVTMNALIGNETILRTRLGGLLVNIAGRYKLLTAAQLEAAAAQRAALGSLSGWSSGLNALTTGLKAAVTGMGRLTVASLRFIATPIGAVITAIALAVGLIITAFKRFPQIVQPALDALNASLGVLRGAFAAVFAEGTLLGNMLRGISDIIKNILITVATQASHVLARFALQFTRLAAAVTFVNETFSDGPRQAWANYIATLEEADAEFAALTKQITAAAAASRSGTSATEEFSTAIEDAGTDVEETAKQVKAAEKNFTSFQNRLRGMKIDLIPDDLQRDLAKTREEFRLFRNDIREAAEENPQFKPFEKGLIAAAFEQEEQEILRIQAEYADKRKAEAEKQAKELADGITERERAIVDAQTRGRLNQADALTLEYQRRMQDTEAMYGDLIARAKSYGQDSKRLEELRAEELTAIHEGYERDVLAIYDDLYAQIETRQGDLVRAAAQERGDERGLLGLDLDKELRDLNVFYAKARTEAAANAALLAALDEQEANERSAIRQKYWADVTRLTEQAAAAVNDREEALAKARAAFAGDQTTVLRIAAAAELREVHAAYDKLEAAAEGNAVELARIAALRNEEVALADAQLVKSISDLNEKAFADTQRPLIDALTKGLDDATSETLAGIEHQLLAWRAAYGGNGEVAALINAALDKVAGRHEKLAEEAAKHIQDLVKSAASLTAGVFNEDAQRGLSDLDQALYDATVRANDLRAEQERIATALLTATGREREELLRSAQALDDALVVVNRNVLTDAERMTREAIETYQAGLEAAKRDASQAAAQLVQADVERVIGNLTALQTNALAEARLGLLRAMANLTAHGVESSTLDPLREQVAQIDALMAQRARATADFASDQLAALRDVAAATLDEAAAQRVAQATYRETIRLRREALNEAQRETAGVEELAAATRAVTDAQVAYLNHLQDQAAALQAVKGQYAGVYSAAADLATLLDKPVPARVIDAQEQLATAALRSVRAAQEAGQSFADYGDDLQNATKLWRDYQAASQTALHAQAQQLRKDFDLNGLMPNDNRIRDLARRLTESFGIGITDAQSRVMNFIKGTTTSLFDGLDPRQPIILSEIFADLNKEAVKTPEVIDGIDAQITTLTDQVEDLKAEIASAVNFDAAGQQLISGYQAVLEGVQVVTGDVFAESASDAVTAFLDRFGSESNRLQEELEGKLGAAAQAAGLAAGVGLMTAFAAGVTANRQVLLSAVERVLEEVRMRLPSSDAKRGPLSDLTHSGRMLVRTFMGGAMREQGKLATSMNTLLGGLTPNASFRAANANAGSAGGMQRGPVTVNVDGRASAAPGPLAVDARRLVQHVDRELKARGIRRR